MVIKVYYNDDVFSTLENLKTASSQSSGIIVGKVNYILFELSFIYMNIFSKEAMGICLFID